MERPVGAFALSIGGMAAQCKRLACSHIDLEEESEFDPSNNTITGHCALRAMTARFERDLHLHPGRLDKPVGF